MSSFSAKTRAEAVVLAPQQDIWDVLVDPELMARFTPFLESITADGDHWRWQLSGLNVLGAKVAPAFTERMVFQEPDRIEFRHDPPAGTTEQAGVAGWYALTPTRRRDRAGHRARDHPRPAAAEGVGTGRARGHAQGHRHAWATGSRSNLLAHLGVEEPLEPRPHAGDLLVARTGREAERVSVTASSYSITMRLHTAPDHGIVGAVATAISAAGGVVTAIDVVDSTRERLVLDVTCSASDADHSHELEEAVDAIDGVEVYKVSDRTFLLHIGGKIEVSSKVPLKNRDDLSMAYTPGVGRVSMALYNNPEDVSRLTIKGNSVAVVTDGSAVLGLGNIGPGAALPVMEGKAALFKRFANIDAWPICLASQDTDEIVKAVEMIAPGFGGINLEDIAAPRCFEIERRLRESLDIPVFHDDQHGTAIVVLAALTNALRVVGRS